MSFKSGRRPVMPISHYFSRYFYGVTRDVNKAKVRCKWAVFDFFLMMPFGPCPTPSGRDKDDTGSLITRAGGWGEGYSWEFLSLRIVWQRKTICIIIPLSFSFRIERITPFIHARSFLKLKQWFQTKMNKVYTRQPSSLFSRHGMDLGYHNPI